MQNIRERRELHAIVHKEPASPAPYSDVVPNKAAISQSADIASENGAQTANRSENCTFYSEPDTETFSAPAILIVIVVVICEAIALGAKHL